MRHLDLMNAIKTHLDNSFYQGDWPSRPMREMCGQRLPIMPMFSKLPRVTRWPNDQMVWRWVRRSTDTTSDGDCSPPCANRNGTWYWVKYSSLKSLCWLKKNTTLAYHIREWSFLVLVFWPRVDKSKRAYDICCVQARCSCLRKMQIPGHELISYVLKPRLKTGIKVHKFKLNAGLHDIGKTKDG